MTDKALLALLARADRNVSNILGRMITALTDVGIDYSSLPQDEMFRFADQPKDVQQEVSVIVDTFAQQLEKAMTAAITAAMQASYAAAAQAIAALNLPKEVFQIDFNKTIVAAFRSYRDDKRKALNLSQRVWNFSSQNKAEFELAMSQKIEDGIAQGISAEELARQVRSMLNRPDEVYRRYHMRKMMSDGSKRDVVEWRRRTIDADGKVHFTSTDIESVGRGVYRSSRMNARRLAVTEINMSYRYADCTRMQQDKFCRGYEIRLSNNHPVVDICDELCGEYPKDFMFTGWHPHCRCAIIPIMAPLQERLDYLDLSEDEQQQWKPEQGYVTELPDCFNDYVADNADKIEASLSGDRPAYFLRDNAQAIKRIIKDAQSEE
jgi:hypothetical protein